MVSDNAVSSIQHLHSIQYDKILNNLGVSPEKGLSGKQIRQRKAEYGANKLRETKARGPLDVLAAQFKTSWFCCWWLQLPCHSHSEIPRTGSP